MIGIFKYQSNRATLVLLGCIKKTNKMLIPKRKRVNVETAMLYILTRLFPKSIYSTDFVVVSRRQQVTPPLCIP